jgi:phospholipid/cholesterol/gamma-HCH transport system substrate-binding protein
MTATPIETTQLLTDLDTTVNSVNKQSLTTVVDEFGKAFNGTGGDLGQIVDTSNSFIRSANANFDITTALLEDSNKVLATQVDKTSAIKSFSRDLSLFSTTLANSDGDLRRVIENGSATANQLRTFLEQNKVDLGQLINNLVTTGEVTGRHLDGTEMILVVYPYVVAGGYTVVAKDRSSGLYDAHFGLILQQDPPVCKAGYNTRQRDPNRDRGDVPMNTRARCTEPASKSNARGAQNTPRRAGPSYRAPVVGTYDRGTGKLSYTDTNPSGDVTYTGGAAALMGEESWKWLLMQPLSGQE